MGHKIHPRALSLFHSPNFSGASFLQIRSDFIRGAYICTNVCHFEDEVLLFGKHFALSMKTRTYIRTSLLLFWMLWGLVSPRHIRHAAGVVLQQSVVCGQPRARVQFILFVLVTPNRRCSYLQLRGTSSLILHTNFSSESCVWTSCPSCGLCLKSCGIRPFTTFSPTA